MDEKRKAYATLTFRKPRISLLLSAILVLAIAAVAAYGILQERSIRAAALKSLEDSLRIAESHWRQAEGERDALETRLAAAESKLTSYRQAYADPAGYYDYSEGKGKWLRLFTCSSVVLESLIGGESNSATLVGYNLVDRKATADLTRRDNYEAVGEYDWTPRGDEFETIYFHLRADVMADHPFTWPDSDEWPIVHRNWEDYLEDYCSLQ